MKQITRLVALAATATAMSLGSTAVWANLITTNITGCVASGASTAADCKSGNVFDDVIEAGEGNGTFIANYANAKNVVVFTLTASFGSDDTFTLKFENKKATPTALLTDSVMFFGGLQFTGGEEFFGLGDATLTDAAGNLLTTPAFPTNDELVKQMFDAQPIIGEDANGGWFKLDFSNTALPVPANQTIILNAKLVKGVPEPGSLALLGAVLVAFGVIQVQRRRRS